MGSADGESQFVDFKCFPLPDTFATKSEFVINTFLSAGGVAARAVASVPFRQPPLLAPDARRPLDQTCSVFVLVPTLLESVNRGGA